MSVNRSILKESRLIGIGLFSTHVPYLAGVVDPVGGDKVRFPARILLPHLDFVVFPPLRRPLLYTKEKYTKTTLIQMYQYCAKK